MKKKIAFTLALLCALLLCACGANPGGDQTTAALPTLEGMTGEGSDAASTAAPEPSGTAASEPSGTQASGEAVPTTEYGAVEEETVVISTPYADLRVPASFDRAVSHQETGSSPYELSFRSKADGEELFSLVFNGSGDYLVGTLLGTEGNTVLYARIPALDENSQRYQDNLFYQEQMHLILEYLAEDYELVPEETLEGAGSGDFEIKTSLVSLYYPSRWKEKVEIEVLDNGVKFSAAGTPLFDLMFEECDGYLLGTYQETPIYMVEYPVETEEQAAMQAGVNTILQHLSEDPNFMN